MTDLVEAAEKIIQHFVVKQVPLNSKDLAWALADLERAVAEAKTETPAISDRGSGGGCRPMDHTPKF